MLSNSIIRLTFLTLILIGLIYCILRLNSFLSFPDLNTKIVNNKELYNKIINDPFSNYSERSKVAVKFAELAESSKDTEEKISYLCETLEALSSALKKEPLRSRTLVTWANVKQLLGSYHCPGDVSDGFEQALSLALNSDPLDQQALFNSAIVFLWAGQKERAYPIFKRVLELGTDSSALQREFIYSLANDGASLQALIPVRLPQVIDFTRYVLSQPLSSPVNKIKKSVLWEFQTAAVLEFAARYDQELIDNELYLNKLLDFWKLCHESAVTPVVDKLLAKYFVKNGPAENATFFSERSRFTELEIVSALRTSDSRPEKSSLYNWGYQGEVFFDEFYSSLGFYLPRKKTLRRIELQSNYRVDKQLVGLVRVLQSDDNNSWEDVTGVTTAYQIALPDRWILYIDLPGATKRFWKLHYANSSRGSEFKGALTYMVRAFGIGALDE